MRFQFSQLFDGKCARISLGVMLGAKGDHPGRFVMLLRRPRRIEMMVHQVRVAAVDNRTAEPDLPSKFAAYLSRWSSVHSAPARKAAQAVSRLKYTKKRLRHVAHATASDETPCRVSKRR